MVTGTLLRNAKQNKHLISGWHLLRKQDEKQKQENKLSYVSERRTETNKDNVDGLQNEVDY